MATSGGTPKKFYKSISVSTVISRCRLCYSVGDPKHCKNLFGDSNRAILRSAESFYGSELPQSSDLPHLICRPCERRLNTVIQFKQTIGETQRKVREGAVQNIVSTYRRPSLNLHLKLEQLEIHVGAASILLVVNRKVRGKL
jgi:hypothetical protein